MNNHRPPTRSPGLPRALDLDKHRNPNGTFDGTGVMSELTSLPRDEIRAIAEQVKANHAKLAGCAYHDFAELPDGEGMAGSKPRYRCQHCQGEIDARAHRWHESGRRPKPPSDTLTRSTPDRCLACGEYHGMSGLPCPKMRATS